MLIEKRFQSPLYGFNHCWLNVPSHYHEWLRSLNSERDNYLSCLEEKNGYERHLLFFIISRSNWYSILISLLLILKQCLKRCLAFERVMNDVCIVEWCTLYNTYNIYMTHICNWSTNITKSFILFYVYEWSVGHF